ncbi:Major Facilitator Superfamily protein [Stieleria neptunia]|uniref:Major Facilitator Superfamily protein n=1 Tax=Stieleria neptunia TaxID=2527979 RepID=A0A518HTM1_9BACT|nr:MFS transporter [Stieleria neptunia]QDV44171.1 Major Facilitator Superfamily protein [Stieleria neptunia]
MNSLSDRLARRLPFFYGYLMLPIAMLMQLGTSPGQTFAVSAFTPSLLASLDLTQSRLGLAYMLGTLFAAVPLTFVGPAADRHGLKRVASIVIVGLALACLFASSVSGFYGLLAAFFLLRFLGQGSLTLLSGNTTAMWFRNRIGRVSAVLSIGSAVAFAWVPDWLASAIEAIGWRSTYQSLAAVLVLTLLPLVLLLYRNRPEDLGQFVDGHAGRLSLGHATETSDSMEVELETEAEIEEDPESLSLAQAARTGSYHILGLSNVIWAMAGTGVLFYLFTLCEQREMPSDTASGLFKILGMTMLAMQLGGGVLADFLKLNRLLGLGTAMVAGSLIWLYLDPSVRGAQVFAGLFGGGQGMLISVSGVAWVRYYGRQHLGSIRGAVWCGTVAGSGCGPLIMGWVNDATGSYDQAILCFAAAMMPLAIAAWFIRPPQPVTAR